MGPRARYERLKAMGICPICEVNKAQDGKVTCRSCRERAKQINKENRDYKRSHNLCVKCGRNYCAPNRKYCDECLEYFSEWKKNKYSKPENKDLAKLYRDRCRAKKKENHLCECGNPVYENNTLCYDCLVAKRNRARRNRALAKEYKGE